MRSRELRQRLRATPVPGAGEAEERSWDVVRAAFEERERVARAPARPRRLVLAVAGACLLAVAILSPAGASVRDWIGDVVEPGQAPLTSLPAPGRLLVESEQGPWVVQQDGSMRLLGDYEQATWSPSGLYVAVTGDSQLTAVDPLGEARWSKAHDRSVREPRWAPSGFRIAYLSGDSLRVIAGDGSDPRQLAEDVAPTPPAWRPFLPSTPQQKLTGEGTHVLAFAGRDGTVTAMDIDSGERLWHADLAEVPRQLQWSPDRERLIALTDSAVRVLDQAGEPQVALYGPGATADIAAISPDGKRIALVRERPEVGRSQLVLVRIEGPATPRERVLYTGRGKFTDLAWSPDGRWLLLAWRDADQWVFLRPRPEQKLLKGVEVARDISHQFDPGASGTPAFPRVSGWCCAP